MDMKILVVGGGGREHALTEALSRSSNVTICSVMFRKNPGIAALSEEICLCRETDVPAVVAFAKECGAMYAVIGPEAPLEAGLADALEAEGISCIGPTREAARIETDKEFCRNLMKDYGIPGCPAFAAFHDIDAACAYLEASGREYAIKPIGLTGGKGVKIMGEHVGLEGAKEYIREIGGEVVLEERLIGEEFTLMTFVDGEHVVPMPLVQDHKRAFEGDEGPNTGGMGAYSMPDHMLPFVTGDDYRQAVGIMEGILGAMRAKGLVYKGFLYGQFMVTADGPMVIEFNARFGDPEAMNLLALLSSDFGRIVTRIAEGTLGPDDVSFLHKASVCKYLVPEGYPENPQKGMEIAVGDYGDAVLYYANVVEEGGVLFTQTSRTLAFVGLGDTLEEAEAIAERAAAGVTGAVRHRTDIGTRAVLERRMEHMREIR